MTIYRDDITMVKCEIDLNSESKVYDCTIFRNENMYALKHGSIVGAKQRILRDIDKILVDGSINSQIDENAMLKLWIHYPKDDLCEVYDEIETQTQRKITVLKC